MCTFCQSDGSAERSGAAGSLCLSVGINDFNQRDKYLSPYIFSGTIFGSSLSYRVSSGMSLHRIDVFFSLGSLNSGVQASDVYQDVGLFSYSYVHSVGRWKVMNSPLELSLGGGELRIIEGVPFLRLSGSYYEMGKQYGVLMKERMKELIEYKRVRDYYENKSHPPK